MVWFIPSLRARESTTGNERGCPQGLVGGADILNGSAEQLAAGQVGATSLFFSHSEVFPSLSRYFGGAYTLVVLFLPLIILLIFLCHFCCFFATNDDDDEVTLCSTRLGIRFSKTTVTILVYFWILIFYCPYTHTYTQLPCTYPFCPPAASSPQPVPLFAHLAVTLRFPHSRRAAYIGSSPCDPVKVLAVAASDQPILGDFHSFYFSTPPPSQLFSDCHRIIVFIVHLFLHSLLQLVPHQYIPVLHPVPSISILTPPRLSLSRPEL